MRISFRSILALAVASAVVGAMLLGLSIRLGSTTCTTEHGSLEICTYATPIAPVYAALLWVLSGGLVAGAFLWQRTHPNPMP